MMESTQRRCPVEGCERRPQPGWTRCEQHAEEWLTHIFRSAVPDRPAELPRYSIPENELRALHGDR
jgi:hypothetical protein